MSKCATRYRECLESVGVEADVRYVDVRRGKETGAYLTAMVRQLMGAVGLRPRPKEGEYFHAVEHELALPGTAAATFHDLSSIYAGGPPALLAKTHNALSLAYARRPIAITATVRDGLAKHYGRVQTKRVRVVPLPFPKVAAEIHEVRDNHLLWVGNNAPRKQLPRFLGALRLADKRLSVTIRHQHHPRFPKADFSGLGFHDVRIIDHYIPERDLNRIYRKTRAIVSTSVSEGTPAPLVEAYLRGVHLILPTAGFFTECFPPSWEGIHYYDARFPERLGELLADARGWGEFSPDDRLEARHAYDNVGEQLKAVYEESSLSTGLPEPNPGARAAVDLIAKEWKVPA